MFSKQARPYEAGVVSLESQNIPGGFYDVFSQLGLIFDKKKFHQKFRLFDFFFEVRPCATHLGPTSFLQGGGPNVSSGAEHLPVDAHSHIKHSAENSGPAPQGRRDGALKEYRL